MFGNVIKSPRLLLCYAILGLLVPNVTLCFSEHLPLMAGIANILLPLSVYSLLMTLSAKTGRQVWMLFLIVFFAAFQLVLIYLYGSGVIAVDMFLNLITTNPGEALELLDNLAPAVTGVFVLYLPLLGMAAWQWKKGILIDPRALVGTRRVAMYGCVAAALFTAANYWIYPSGGEKEGRYEYHVENDLYPANVFYNLGLAIQEAQRSAHYKELTANFRFNAKSTHAKDSAEVYVLVIGETARSRNFQLYGYNRPTNPLLMKEGGLTVFRNVTSQSNTTHKSVPMLLTAANAEDHDRLYREKGIIAAFREAGFYTTFFSNQKPNHSYIDFLGEEADEHLFISKTIGKDEQLLAYVKRTLAKRHHKLLIVLHMYGSHFNYRDRYPQSRAFFTPDTPTEAKAANRPQLLNAYDNTIRQTDYILATIINMLHNESCAAAMLYTSDHGENIFDDHRKLFLHASPRPSEYDIDVPLIIWTSEVYNIHHPDIVEAMKKNKNKGVQSSASVFPTMLSIAGIETKSRVDSMSLTNPNYKLGKRYYLNDHNNAVMLAKDNVE